jgi:hypothetical protein
LDSRAGLIFPGFDLVVNQGDGAAPGWWQVLICRKVCPPITCDDLPDGSGWHSGGIQYEYRRRHRIDSRRFREYITVSGTGADVDVGFYRVDWAWHRQLPGYRYIGYRSGWPVHRYCCKPGWIDGFHFHQSSELCLTGHTYGWEPRN